MKRTLTLCSLAMLLGSAANAQYDTLWIGTPDGPSTSLANTPFPTAPGRAARTQYLIRSEDLVGLEPSDVLGICVQVVDDDQTEPACLVDLHAHMKNTTTASFVDFEYTGNQHAATAESGTLSAGILSIPFNVSPFQWIGPGFNVMVEISYERGADAGISPRILLDTDLGYAATYTGHTAAVMTGHDISSQTPGVVLGSDNSLPVLGLLKSAVSAIDDEHKAELMSVFPNPSSEAINVRLPFIAEQLRVTDALGRLLVQTRPTSTSSQLEIRGLSSGCYVMQALAEGRVITSTRFIKE